MSLVQFVEQWPDAILASFNIDTNNSEIKTQSNKAKLLNSPVYSSSRLVG
jgi:hypothetical protein